MMGRNKRVVKNLNDAVEKMRDACDDAARAVTHSTDQDSARRVLHALAWGFANASSSIECAMSALEDALPDNAGDKPPQVGLD